MPLFSEIYRRLLPAWRAIPTMLVAGLLATTPATAGEAAQTATEARGQCLAAKSLEIRPSCEAALEAQGDDREVLRHLAWVMLSHNMEEESIRLFHRLVQLDPQDAEAHFQLAAAQATLFNYAQAEEAVRTALRLRPDHLPSHRLAGIVYEYLGLDELAFSTHLTLARAGLRTGMYDLAQDFHYGRGTARDGLRARNWYEAAAEKGHVAAMDMLAKGHKVGVFGEPDDAAAKAWRERAEEARGYWPPLLGPGRDG
jgi:TPR repeat protein